MTRLFVISIIVMISSAAFAEDIITRPLTPKTGDYAETPVSKPPKDENLKKIYEDAEKGGYPREQEQAIEKYGGERLKEEWGKKRD